MEPAQRLTTARASEAAGPWTAHLWTASQRRAIAVVLIILSVVVLWRTSTPSIGIGDSLATSGERAGELVDRLDPNTASAAELRLLPRVGPSIADRIIAYRQQRLAERPGQPAFGKLQDLDAVPGVGPAMLEQLEPHLRFP